MKDRPLFDLELAELDEPDWGDAFYDFDLSDAFADFDPGLDGPPACKAEQRGQNEQ